MAKTKSNKLVCVTCAGLWFQREPRAAPKALRCLNHLHSLLTLPQIVIELGAWRACWKYCLMFLNRERQDTVQLHGAKSHNLRSHKVTDALHAAGVWFETKKNRHWSTIYFTYSFYSKELCFLRLFGQLLLLSCLVKWAYYSNYGFYESHFLRSVSWSKFSSEYQKRICWPHQERRTQSGFIVYLHGPSVKIVVTGAKQSLLKKSWGHFEGFWGYSKGSGGRYTYTFP